MAELPRRKSKQVDGRPKHRLTHSRNPIPELYRKGAAAQDYRRSYANVWRRLERGETPQVCAGCGCETDAPTPAHANRCEER
jgi:hypothetical protein